VIPSETVAGRKFLRWLSSGLQRRVAASIIRAIIARMMEAARTPETLVNFYQITRRYNPEDSYLRENLKSYL
jgi:hypothetical protein